MILLCIREQGCHVDVRYDFAESLDEQCRWQEKLQTGKYELLINKHICIYLIEFACRPSHYISLSKRYPVIIHCQGLLMGPDWFCFGKTEGRLIL